MTEILTLLVPPLAVLAGVWVAQRHQGRLAGQARAEARRDSQRRAVVDLLVAGRRKVAMYDTLLPAFTRFGKSSHDELAQFIETDTGRELGRINAELEKALVLVAMTAGDQRVPQLVDAVRLLNQTFPDDVVGPAMQDDLRTAYRNLGRLSRGLIEIEQTASQFLRVPVAEDPAFVARVRGWIKPRTPRRVE